MLASSETDGGCVVRTGTRSEFPTITAEQIPTALAPLVVPYAEPTPTRKRRPERPPAASRKTKRISHHGKTARNGAQPRKRNAARADAKLKPAIIRRRLPRAMKFLRAELAAGAKAEQIIRQAAAEQKIRPEVLDEAIDKLGVLPHAFAPNPSNPMESEMLPIGQVFRTVKLLKEFAVAPAPKLIVVPGLIYWSLS